MTAETLCVQFPHLWHMAEFGSWHSIQKNGLLSTSLLLDQFEVTGVEREAIESKRRPDCVTLSAEGRGSVVIRDQKPMSDVALRKCLQDGLEPSDWYRLLNQRVFFWLSQARLRRLLRARAYRDTSQTVITLATRELVEAYAGRIELSAINSGSTIFDPVPRGKGTFVPVEQYDYEYWREKRGAREAVVELVVPGGVPDVAKYVLAVHNVRHANREEVWRRPGTPVSIGP